VWAHGRVRIEHNNTGEKSFGLTAENDERGGKLMWARARVVGLSTAMQQ
jgi:hypothetical protein